MERERILDTLRATDKVATCNLAKTIVEESKESDVYYLFFEDFAALMEFPKTYVRVRGC